jgi:hypothetical protein
MKHLQKHLKTLHMCENIYMQHPNETLANKRLENEMKHLEHILETYVNSHCNMCNISIYFCNSKTKHLQHLDETSETLETYSCNMGFTWTNEGMPSRRLMAAHELRCAVAARATRLRVWRHTNLVPLACLLEHPSWTLAGSPARWRRSWRAGRPWCGGSAVEAGEVDWASWGMRRRGGSTEEAAGDEVRRGEGVALRGTGSSEAEWGGQMGTTTQGGNGAASIEAHERDERIGSLGERHVME